jgi:CheY-like chemotaxis protein
MLNAVLANAPCSRTLSEFGRDPISHSVARLVCVLLSQCPEFMKNCRLRILTVEDEPAVTKMLALLLGGPAAKVTSASDGWMALMKIGAAAEPFDVIITDHRMRRVNGLELVRRLRVRKFAGKIIVLSAHLTKENIRAYEELNVDMMLAKPFDVEELQLAMNLLTKKPSASVTAPMAAQA